jgi:anti-sigma regulatory factor (Ser/Thr protein kinase)
MFGEERLMNIFTTCAKPETLFDSVLAEVQKFIGDGEKDDDLSLFEITMDSPKNVNVQCQEANERFGNAEIEWNMSFEVKPTSFKIFDPLSMLLNVLMEVPSLRSFSSTLYTILAELYTNALDHGVLGLDSTLKHSADGFSEYYRLREERINKISTGFVRIYITHLTNTEGGTLKVRVEDSGKGFDYTKDTKPNLEGVGYCGRGIALIEKLCGAVRYYGVGNIAEVDFSWVSDD